MGYLLLWIENLATVLLWVALMSACLARVQRKWQRRALWAVLVWIPLSVFYFAWLGAWIAIGEAQVAAKMPATLGWSLLLVVCVIAGVVWLRRRARRTEVMQWPVGRLVVAWAAVAALHLITFWNMDLAVRARLASLRAESGALALSVMSPAMPDELNAAVDYQRAFDQFDQAHWEGQGSWDDWGRSQPSPNVDVKAIGAYLQQQAGVLDLLRQGAQKPTCSFQFVLGRLDVETLLPRLGEARQASRLLCLSARWRAAHGDLSGALGDLSDAWRLAGHIGQEPVLVSSLVCLSIRGHVMPNLEALLAEYEFTADDLAQMQATWESSTRAWRIINRSVWLDTANSASVLAGYTSGDSAILPDPSLPHPLRGPGAVFYRVFLATGEVADYRTMLDQMVQWSSQPSWQVRPEIAAFRQQFEQSHRGFFARLLVSGYKAAYDSALHADALTVCTVATLAAMRYHDERHAWPQAVDELYPQYLLDRPVDPYTGQALKMKAVDGKLVFYSVGPDEVDDGGTAFDSSREHVDVTFRVPMQ